MLQKILAMLGLSSAPGATAIPPMCDDLPHVANLGRLRVYCNLDVKEVTSTKVTFCNGSSVDSRGNCTFSGGELRVTTKNGGTFSVTSGSTVVKSKFSLR